MSGRVGDLTEQQMTALDELRANVDDILRPSHDDYFLLRWLRARNFNVAQAEAMLRENLQWRKQNNVDAILDDYEPTEVLKKYYPGGLVGHDKEGCPLWIIPFGYTDIKGLFYSVKKSDFIRHIIQQLEYSAQDMAAQTEKSSSARNQVKRQTTPASQASPPPYKKALLNKLATSAATPDRQQARPRRTPMPRRHLGTPKIYPIIYNMVKPFLSEETAKKIHVFGKDKWKEALLQDIAPEELPVHWGGTMTGPDGDPRCTHIVGAGGPVPCSCYTAPSRRLSSDQNLKMCVIEKKSAVPLTVEVTEAGSILRWEFQTENYDIGFGVFFVPDSNGTVNGDGGGGSGDMQELVAMQRVNCHLVPEDGMLVCNAPGKYVLKFDNSFSWYRSKKLLYHYQVLPPTPA
ncbi:SEC14-like protein 2 [Dermacentor silvarum]|uniref:SEC14-like protein 2 n=1 Tax=Dermacentor silvarum TaxID=543639 RepID=UPI00210172BF|nr:SEC14-like protein 2 [Dermacentor silvarum]